MLKYIKYLLVSEKYKKSEDKNVFELNNVISIPESLYVLEMLCRGNFDMIGDITIQEQLKLFNLLPVDNVSIEQLNNLINYGIIQENHSEIDKKIEKTTKVLKLMKN